MVRSTKRNKLRKRKCKTMKRGGMKREIGNIGPNEVTQQMNQEPKPRSKPGQSIRLLNTRVLSGRSPSRSASRLITNSYNAKLASLSTNSTKFTLKEQFAARIIGIFHDTQHITLEKVNFIASRIPDDALKRFKAIFANYTLFKNYQQMIDELTPICKTLDISTLPLDTSEKKRRRLNNRFE
jgi:hypothetical protein